MSIFKDKVLMITGGTGSFGNAVLNRFLKTDIAEIRIFSRDEKKQDDMRHFLQANRSDVAHKVKFYIGNVRTKELLNHVSTLHCRNGCSRSWCRESCVTWQRQSSLRVPWRYPWR